MAHKHLSEAQLLENFSIALTNTEKQPIIATTMAEFGYDGPKIEEGKQLLGVTRQSFVFNKQEDDETNAARAAFIKIKSKVHDAYSLHRKKGKVVFKDDEVMLKKLGLTGTLSYAYIKWIESMKTFYREASADTEIQTKLARLKLSPEQIAEGQADITEMGAARAEYKREIGESQEATREKDLAFAKMDDWMSEFYSVAKIAMEEKPQLLESLGMLVRS